MTSPAIVARNAITKMCPLLETQDRSYVHIYIHMFMCHFGKAKPEYVAKYTYGKM